MRRNKATLSNLHAPSDPNQHKETHRCGGIWLRNQLFFMKNVLYLETQCWLALHVHLVRMLFLYVASKITDS